MKLSKKERVPYYLILPTIAILVVFMVYPIFNTVYLSLQEKILTQAQNEGFIGISNYVNLMQDTTFWTALKNTVVWTVSNVALQLSGGLILALMLNMQFKGRAIFRTLIFTPWALGGMLVALIFGFMFNGSIGVISDLLLNLGISSTRISWLSTKASAMVAVIIANTWRGIPFFAISILSSLQTISLEIYESADVDGANAWTKFTKITMPLIKNTVLLTTLLRTIWTLNVVDVIYGMTSGGPNYGTLTLPVYVIKIFSETLNMGYASALAVIMILILLVFTMLYLKIGKYGKEEIY